MLGGGNLVRSVRHGAHRLVVAPRQQQRGVGPARRAIALDRGRRRGAREGKERIAHAGRSVAVDEGGADALRGRGGCGGHGAGHRDRVERLLAVEDREEPSGGEGVADAALVAGEHDEHRGDPGAGGLVRRHASAAHEQVARGELAGQAGERPHVAHARMGLGRQCAGNVDAQVGGLEQAIDERRQGSGASAGAAEGDERATARALRAPRRREARVDGREVGAEQAVAAGRVEVVVEHARRRHGVRRSRVAQGDDRPRGRGGDLVVVDVVVVDRARRRCRRAGRRAFLRPGRCARPRPRAGPRPRRVAPHEERVVPGAPQRECDRQAAPDVPGADALVPVAAQGDRQAPVHLRGRAACA